MSLIKRNNTPESDLYTDLFNIDRFFEQPLFRTAWPAAKIPAANISENEKEFLIELAVPGIKRDNIRVDIENKVLTVSGEQEAKEEKSNGRYTRREYSYDSFARSFELPDTVEQDNISAQYQDGVLELHIPKKNVSAVGEKRRQIAIS